MLKAACRQEMWINPLDAQKRGIHNGDKVRIFNDRGEVHIQAKVTPRMMPVCKSHWVKVPGMTRMQNVSIRVVVLTY
ncbi:molybdopterin dinucleotide binding domain-containing protein [Escherichia coli]